MTLKRTVLYDNHVSWGAKMGEFGGWEMPISYPNGTLNEHIAVRTGAGLFDVSHLGTVRVEGYHAFNTLQNTLTNDLNKISVGRAQYTHLLDQNTGGVIDDIIVWWTDSDGFDVMPNASNTSRVISSLSGTDVTSDRAIIALQGPKYKDVLIKVVPMAVEISHFNVGYFEFKGTTIKISGTGYTGELGVELYCPNEIAPEIWEQLISAGAAPAGLGARDTLRLEAGLPLHGHELTSDVTPLQAGLEWVVAFGKDSFNGKDALLMERQNGIGRRLVGLKGLTRQPLREDQEISYEGREIGHTTSGSFSPILQVGIALGFIKPSIPFGETVEINIRGRSVQAIVTKTPFINKAYAS